MTEQEYPGISDRVKAIVADSIVILLLIIAFTYLLSFFENVPEYVRIIVFIFIFIIYDPLFTSVFGGTVGHMMFGLRVKRESNEMKNILFPFALIRFIVKAFLGWLSLLTVHNNKKRKAIHDYLVRSIVIYQNSNNQKTNTNV